KTTQDDSAMEDSEFSSISKSMILLINKVVGSLGVDKISSSLT
ncbi:7259_t:CDS:1, partial [Racocetra persica]